MTITIAVADVLFITWRILCPCTASSDGASVKPKWMYFSTMLDENPSWLDSAMELGQKWLPFADDSLTCILQCKSMPSNTNFDSTVYAKISHWWCIIIGWCIGLVLRHYFNQWWQQSPTNWCTNKDQWVYHHDILKYQKVITTSAYAVFPILIIFINNLSQDNEHYITNICGKLHIKLLWASALEPRYAFMAIKFD